MSSSSSMLEVKQLSKAYPRYKSPVHRLWAMLSSGFQPDTRVALEDITFDLKRGETLAIIGRNGAGKSTLLQMICNTLTPTSGQVHAHGKIAALLELGAGFNPDFTGRENVYLNAALHGLTRREVDQRMSSILDFADIGDYIDQPVRTYSSGMYVRLAFAAIAHVDADILIIDEALAVGDAFFVQKCMRFLREFQRTGSILFVSHDSAAVTALCDRALWIQDGRVRMLGVAKTVSEAYLAQQFDTDAADSSQESFGSGGAQISGVDLLDEKGQVMTLMSGGEFVRLRVAIEAHHALASPIVGFYVKDRLGQTLFGDNTWQSYAHAPVAIPAGKHFVAEFSFVMPRLMTGTYTVAAAVAEGTQAQHEQHHWVHDALAFQVVQPDGGTGLVGIPMQQITIQLDT